MSTSTPTSDFLTKLLALCDEYSVGIGGCGCCGSPYVFGAVDGDYLEVNPEHGTASLQTGKESSVVVTATGEVRVEAAEE